MNIPVHILSQGKSPSGEESEPPSEGSEKAPQYSNFDKVIREEFGIINHIELLFSQTSEKTSQGAQGLDQSNDKAAKTVQPNVHKDLLCASTRKIKKTG
jgi:hypothetical protein